MEDGNQNLKFLKKKISIVDYKGSNLLSLYNAFKYIGFESEITSELKIIKESDFIILPGVGSFAHSMKTIKKLGIDKVIIEKSNSILYMQSIRIHDYDYWIISIFSINISFI